MTNPNFKGGTIELHFTATISPDGQGQIQKSENNNAHTDLQNLISAYMTIAREAVMTAMKTTSKFALEVTPQMPFNAETFLNTKTRLTAPYILQAVISGLGVPEEDVQELMEDAGKQIIDKIKLSEEDNQAVIDHLNHRN